MVLRHAFTSPAPFPTSVDWYEAHAEKFYRETGIVAPGKDRAAAEGAESDKEYERRYYEWYEWLSALGVECPICSQEWKRS